jgi:2-phosphosulfolactate phosphatase
MRIDVALLPSEARLWPPRVCIVVDELRASSTITTALDLGCSALFVTRRLDEARRLATRHGAVLAGERRGIRPAGFDCNDSPTELGRMRLDGRPVVLTTANGTAVLTRVASMPVVLVGCLLDARACAEAAVALAGALRLDVGVVCAGVLGRFAFEDALAAGVIVDRLRDVLVADGRSAELTDGALAAAGIAASAGDPAAAMERTVTGRLLHAIDAPEDIAFCARVDVSASVAILRPERPLRLERLDLATDRAAPRLLERPLAPVG